MARNKQKKRVLALWRQLPSWGWKLALYKHPNLERAPAEGYQDGRTNQDNRPNFTENIEDANLITSESSRIQWTNKHRPVLDLDFAAALVPSTTEGHYHLFLDKEVPWDKYSRLLKAMADCGILEQGYVNASIERGFTSVRLPWVRKVRHDYKTPIGPENQTLPVVPVLPVNAISWVEGEEQPIRQMDPMVVEETQTSSQRVRPNNYIRANHLTQSASLTTPVISSVTRTPEIIAVTRASVIISDLLPSEHALLMSYTWQNCNITSEGYRNFDGFWRHRVSLCVIAPEFVTVETYRNMAIETVNTRPFNVSASVVFDRTAPARTSREYSGYTTTREAPLYPASVPNSEAADEAMNLLRERLYNEYNLPTNVRQDW